jgi:hypothetical protein
MKSQVINFSIDSNPIIEYNKEYDDSIEIKLSNGNTITYPESILLQYSDLYKMNKIGVLTMIKNYDCEIVKKLFKVLKCGYSKFNNVSFSTTSLRLPAALVIGKMFNLSMKLGIHNIDYISDDAIDAFLFRKNKSYLQCLMVLEAKYDIKIVKSYNTGYNKMRPLNDSILLILKSDTMKVINDYFTCPNLEDLLLLFHMGNFDYFSYFSRIKKYVNYVDNGINEKIRDFRYKNFITNVETLSNTEYTLEQLNTLIIFTLYLNKPAEFTKNIFKMLLEPYIVNCEFLQDQIIRALNFIVKNNEMPVTGSMILNLFENRSQLDICKMLLEKIIMNHNDLFIALVLSFNDGAFTFFDFAANMFILDKKYNESDYKLYISCHFLPKCKILYDYYKFNVKELINLNISKNRGFNEDNILKELGIYPGNSIKAAIH